MKIFRPILAAVLLSLGFLPNLAQAEDIDIYTGSPPTGDVNVLFVLDNESNWAATMDSIPPADADSYANCGGFPGSYFCAQKYALITPVTEEREGYIVGKIGIALMYGNG
jgi:hypothetical protein